MMLGCFWHRAAPGGVHEAGCEPLQVENMKITGGTQERSESVRVREGERVRAIMLKATC